MMDALRRDLHKYRNAGLVPHLGFWAGATYRFGHWADSRRPGLVRLASLGAYKVLAAPFRYVSAVTLPAKTVIGPGLALHHPHSIVVSGRTVIGDDCSIYHEVTIGGGGTKPGLPRIGNNVSIYAGARILGGVTIGDNVEIGANAVVTFDVPSDTVVPSPQSRAIPRETIERLRAGRAGSTGDQPHRL